MFILLRLVTYVYMFLFMILNHDIKKQRHLFNLKNAKSKLFTVHPLKNIPNLNLKYFD